MGRQEAAVLTSVGRLNTLNQSALPYLGHALGPAPARAPRSGARHAGNFRHQRSERGDTAGARERQPAEAPHTQRAEGLAILLARAASSVTVLPICM